MPTLFLEQYRSPCHSLSHRSLAAFAGCQIARCQIKLVKHRLMSSVTKFIRPAGLLDRTKASQFNQQINDCVESGGDIVLIDFKDVTFMDSSGLGAVVLAIKTVQAAGMQIYVCSLNNQLNMLFELSGLNKVIEILNDPEEFEKKILPKKSS